MKIIVSQQGEKIEIIFSAQGESASGGENGKIVDKYTIDKAEGFLVCVDKLMRKRHTVKISSFKNAQLEFFNTGLLTERVVRAIMLGLSF